MKNKFEKEYAKLRAIKMSKKEYSAALHKLVDKYCRNTTEANFISSIILSTRFFEV